MPASVDVNSDRQLIEQCVALLQEHRGQIDGAVEAGEQHADDVKELYAFCCDGMQTIATMLDRGLNTVWASILSRTILEISIRLLWTVSEADGWERQIQRWAKERWRWAKRILKSDPDHKDAAETLAACDKVLGGLKGDTKCLPALDQILDAVDDEEAFLSTYTHLYRVQCELAHGGLTAVAHSLKNPEDSASQASVGSLYTTRYLLRAVFRFCNGADLPKNVDSRLGEIINHYRSRE